MSDTQGAGAEDVEDLPTAGADYDRETGEVADGPKRELEEIADATSAKLLRSRPLTAEQIAKATEKATPIPVGVLGWFAKVGASKNKAGKEVPGARCKGQIVGTMASVGQFGKQTSIIVFGRYQCPAHLKGTTKVPAVDKVGRWMIGIDSTLTELPGHVGDILDLELEQKGGPGTAFRRHTYKRVDIWTLDSLEITPEA